MKDYIDLEGFSAEKIADLLTKSGLEVEGLVRYENIHGGLEGLVIGKVLTVNPHPNADKLSLTTVDIGNGSAVPIVCGAPNVAEGQKVVVAPVGTTIYPVNHDPVRIKRAKIRGEVSEGMIVAEDEVGLGESHEGIIVLDTNLPNGTPASEYFNVKTDYILEIGLTPNRADAASHIGVARDLRALINRELKLPVVDHFKVDNHDFPVSVTIENPEACPRYSGLTITGVSIKPSPDWLQNRLKAIGLTPINNVVDITNYVLHELGQPLHAFDADKIKGNKVVVQTLPKGTKFKTLDEKERELLIDDLMICNEEEGMCIAGVFGGLDSGVTENTRNIFLESAYFSPDYIRKTAQYHGLKTDASFRFERGANPDNTVYALKRAALLMQELCNGKISSEVEDEYPHKIEPFNVKVKFSNIDRLIGKKLPHEKIFRILKNLDIKVEQQDNEGFRVVVPPYRVDVTREADVIEEILRIYGYDNIELSEGLSTDYLSEFPVIDNDDVQFKIVQLLAANGFNEIITNSLTKPVFAEKINEFDQENNVNILNKLSEDLGVMRQSLLFTGLEVIGYNIKHRYDDLKVFEFGKEYFRKDNGYQEINKLAIYLTGNVEAENWRNKSRKVDFHDLSAITNKVISKFIDVPPDYNHINGSIYEYGLEVSIAGEMIGRLGKVNRQVCRLSDIKQDVFYAEVAWEKLLKLSQKDFKYEEVSKFPEVRRDLSLVIDKNITFEEIKKVALKQENRLIRNINIFDYYEGENIGKNKKAYALSFILQEKTKTLTDIIIDKTMERLMRAFKKELGAVIRK